MRRIGPALEGVVLVLMSATLALLLVLGSGFAMGSRVFSQGTEVAVSHVRGGVTAASGVEYAVSRLSTDGYPRHPDSPVGRGDSWVARDSGDVPTERMLNPSYAHGEPWRDTIPLFADGLDNDGDGLTDLPDDPSEGNGLFTPGEPWDDLDGDGRFSAWSGRLRGAGPKDPRFTLGIDCEEGRIPVNAGFLDDRDRLIGGYPGTAPVAIQNPPVPDHRDPEADPYHKGLVHVLNNLGTIVRPSAGGPWTNRFAQLAPGGAHLFEFSWLGNDLIAGRPPGGYRTWEDARDALLDRGYRQDECELFGRFIDVGIPEPSESGRMSTPTVAQGFLGSDPADFPCYVPVNLAAASREVLAALWMHLCTHPGYPNQTPCGEASGKDVPSSRTGTLALPFGGSQTPPLHPLTFLIFQDEAENLARRAILARQAGPLSWQGLHQAFIDHAPSLFPVDHADLGGAASPHPLFRNAWLQAKVDLAFRAVACDVPVYAGLDAGAATWGGWGLDRDGNPANGVQQGSFVGMYGIHRIDQPLSASTFFGPFQSPSYFEMDKRIKPQGVSLAPPARFRVRSCAKDPSAGSWTLVEARIRTVESLLFTSQEDFESLSGGTLLARRGIQVVDVPAAEQRRDLRLDDMGSSDPQDDRTYCAVMSLPRPNRRSLADPATALKPPFYGYSRLYGALTLADRQVGRRDAALYWPFKEDFDQSAATDYWPEGDPAFAWAPTAPLPIPVSSPPGAVQNFGFPDSFNFGNGPFHFFCPIASLPECPGMAAQDLAHVGPWGEIQGLAAEFWTVFPSGDVQAGMGTGVSPQLTIWGTGGAGSGFIALRIFRGDAFDPGPHPDRATFEIDVFWQGMDPPATRWVVPFAAGPPANLHVALSLQAFPPDRTELRLHVNGSGQSLQGPMRHVHPALMPVSEGESLSFVAADEIRLYRRTLSPGEPALLHGLDRFVRRGRYTSPLYVLDRPATLGLVQWTGLVPPGLADAAGAPLDPFVVAVEGYSTVPGEPSHPAPAWPQPARLGASGLVEPLPPGRVRSFRYTVGMDCSAAAGVLDDTPVFESIWLTLRRRGRAPSIGDWSEK